MLGFRESARTASETLVLAKSGYLGCYIKSRNDDTYCYMIQTFLVTEMQNQSVFNRNNFFSKMVPLLIL